MVRISKILLLGLAFSLMLLPVIKIYTLHTNLFDLGLFENLFYKLGQNKGYQFGFTGHVQLFLFPYSIILSFFPIGYKAYVLIFSQSFLLLLPCYWFYRHVGTYAAMSYLLYYPVWALALFDFHFDHLAVPLLLGFYIGIIDKRIVFSVLCGTALIFVKEPFALQAAACGALLILLAFNPKLLWKTEIDHSTKRRLYAGGIWLFVFGISYFLFSIKTVLVYFAPVDWVPISGSAFGWLGDSLMSILKTIMLSPHIVVMDIFTTPGKLVYLVVIFGSFAFIPLLRPILLIPALPILGISLISHLPNYYDYNTHYTAGLVIPVVFSFIYGLPIAYSLWEKMLSRLSLLKTEAKRKMMFNACVGIWVAFGHIALSPSPISRLFWSDKVWVFNYNAYLPSDRQVMMKKAIRHYVPAMSAVSIQNNINSSYLANRDIYVPFPQGTLNAYEYIDYSKRPRDGFLKYLDTGVVTPDVIQYIYVGYVVLDLKRPPFILDRGCTWVYEKCLDKKIENDFRHLVEKVKKYYSIVYEADDFIILKRIGENL
ncbi:MAG: DUF2079 domain-containing protein [Pseudomonadales bacterium]|nr:DUF2079 domain-containing protein [Pseudomonadales bacterium]